MNYKNENNLESNNCKCFVETLSILKESSLEAVESSKTLTSLKKYMHVSRPVYEEFDKIIRGTAFTDKAELIFLCGSVGDGKSHLLSYYNANEPELMKKFVIHNDSTASFYMNKPAIYTLKEVLDDFSDDKIEYSKTKLIIAINLGTLNNFIESDGENKFSKLIEFIQVKKILEEAIPSNPFEENSKFHYVNFSDYHLYNLTNTEPKSEYLETLINKLVDENKNNIFFNEYQNTCMNCDSNKMCPIKANYDMLKNPTIRNELIQLIIESIVKNKLIVSTRAIYNMIYEILVDIRFIKTGSLEPRKDILTLSQVDYCLSLLPNSIFSREDSSEIINSMKYIDPVNVRNEEIDLFIVEFNNKDDVLKYFSEELPEIYKVINKVKCINFTEFSSRLRNEMLKLFIRSYRLLGKNIRFDVKDTTYGMFMKNLYYWNIGDKSQLKNIYNIVEKGALNWNGDAGEDEIVIATRNAQINYQISQKVTIKESLSNISINECSYRFSNVIYMKYVDTRSNIDFQIEVDYSLLKLLFRIVKGYCPNTKDKSLNIKFSNFVNKISQFGSKNEILYIKEKNTIERKSYKLEYSSDFGYTFEVI